MIDVAKVLDLHKKCNILWHTKIEVLEEDLPWKFIEENHMWNFSLWHEEDIVRIPDMDALKIVAAKRNIDRFNQLRNNAIEKMDEWILIFLNGLNAKPGNKMHSETPGMIIDRLSIMSLKRFHMDEETLRDNASEEHKLICKQKVSILDEQIFDLSNCLVDLFDSLKFGNLQFKVYRQFKMYNDPNLNPALYSRNIKPLQNDETKIGH